MDTDRSRPTAAEDAFRDTGEILRLIVERRGRLGLGEAELARRAGMSSEYLAGLLRADGAFDPDALLRLAAVLGLTYREPAGAGPTGLPVPQPVLPHPILVRLTEDECWDRLGTHGVGRIALTGDAAPDVYPVSYVVDGATVVYRTAASRAAAAAPGAAVSFEVDRLDTDHHNGWSVLLTGTAERVADGTEDRRLAAIVPSRPWAPGARNVWIRVVPGTVTGRLLRTP